MSLQNTFVQRTKLFVINVIKLYKELPNTTEAQIIGRQWVRCSSSVGANYRAACRARSQKEFSAKLSIVAEEADESIFWMEILIGVEIMSMEKLNYVFKEARKF
ncbi:four helix bundle protein [Mucilaginibacter ginkgonis]|uniref:Four helix bundle protein n=1 Tax=Mucilaginibacter ginkgonis TaxID=2682091 RepID=A0A7T7JHW6_9SPHI|nr:four helix bundle protein [Mucilaginibacter ginkgonis]QQL50784.1 four helix bundle protein [Mucilaginibacter ginkgonis]